MANLGGTSADLGGGIFLNQDIVDALNGAASPSASNVFATMADVAAAGGESLAATLAIGNTTGANDISVNTGQSIIYNNSSFTATISESALTGNIVLTLPAATGTFALLSDIPAAITTFTGLTDTPANYTSAANKFLRVNAGATAVEFLAGSSINVSEFINDAGYITALDGNGIYGGSGSLSGNTTVTQGANLLDFTGGQVNMFNIASDTFSVDGANGRVAIGHTAPTQLLDIRKSVDGNVQILLKNTSTGTSAKAAFTMSSDGSNEDITWQQYGSLASRTEFRQHAVFFEHSGNTGVWWHQQNTSAFKWSFYSNPNTTVEKARMSNSGLSINTGANATASIDIQGVDSLSTSASLLINNAGASELFRVRNNGVIEAPTLSNALITAGIGTTLITKDYLSSGQGGIYGGNGTVPSTLIATLTNTIEFTANQNAATQLTISNPNTGTTARTRLSMTSDVGTFQAQVNSSTTAADPGDTLLTVTGGDMIFNVNTSNRDYFFRLVGATRFAMHGLSGNMGIGTAEVTPTARLEVKGAGTGTGKTFRLVDSADAEVFSVKDNGLIEVKGSMTMSTGDFETLTNTTGFIVLDRTNATRYRIYTSGGVLFTEPA